MYFTHLTLILTCKDSKPDQVWFWLYFTLSQNKGLYSALLDMKFVSRPYFHQLVGVYVLMSIFTLALSLISIN